MAAYNDAIFDVIGSMKNQSESKKVNVKTTNPAISNSPVPQNSSPTLSPMSEEFKNARDALWAAHAKNNPSPKIDHPIEPNIVVGNRAVFYPRHRSF